MKNSLISIYADKELLGKINPNEMEKRLIPPELQAVVDMAKKLPRDYTKQETVALNKAEWTATQGVQLIKRILARGWDERSIALWEELRRMVLMYPTANVEIVTVQQACAFTAYAVRKRRFGKSKSHCEAILNGF
ncbi:MAG: hypothetical protein IJN64_07650 [Lachnospiraceae bacterium]|nr:hypothetical protein [Lachnospiraceae bacterium]